MDEKGRPLSSPVYLGALALLVANDWLFKSIWHNELTGKLSDVTGLFAFTWLAVVLFPRYRRALSLLCALTFVYWKSPHSAALIGAWNGLGFFSIGRVVDPWDCIALATIPLAHVHAPRARARSRRPGTGLLIVALSLIAFTATSVYTEHEYDRSYSFSLSPTVLRQRLAEVALYSREVSPIGILEPEELEIGVPGDQDTGVLSVTVRVDEAPGGTKLRLIKIGFAGFANEEGKNRALELFEARIVERIEHGS